jgi:metal-responsive CopG/Arc/MetJ family transcriptional regulator
MSHKLTKLIISVPSELLAGIDAQLDKYTLTTRSAYVRGVLLEHLRGKGVQLDGAGKPVGVVNAPAPPQRPVCDYDGCHTPHSDYKTCLDGTKYARQNCPCACHKA